jgi:hypothetical protein
MNSEIISEACDKANQQKLIVNFANSNSSVKTRSSLQTGMI